MVPLSELRAANTRIAEQGGVIAKLQARNAELEKAAGVEVLNVDTGETEIEIPHKRQRDGDGDNSTHSSSSSSSSSASASFAPAPSAIAALVQERDSNARALKKVKQEKGAAEQELADRVLCTICLDEERNVLYMPCGHLATCADCDATLTAAAAAADRAAECPMCQTEIGNRVSGVVIP